MTRTSLILLSFVSLACAIGILLVLIFAENLQASTLLQDRVFYVCLILMGIFSAVSLFGYLRSSALINGRFGGFTVQLAGPAALAFIVILGGFYLIPRSEFFDVTIRAVDKNGLTVYSNRKAIAILKLPTGIREADFTKNGEATIKGLPYSLHNSKQKVLIDIYFYEQSEREKEYRLTADVIEVKVNENPNGTPEGILNKKRAHLEVLKLLAPYKLMLGDIGGLEINIEQYYEEGFLELAKRYKLDEKINITNDEKYNYFDVLYENAPEYLNFTGKTYAELIHESAINFRRNVGVMSQIDSEGMKPEIQRELIKLSRANFVVIAAGERPGSIDSSYITEAFWQNLSHEVKRIHDDNVLNFFTEFSDF